jgi:pimeloyl-ACP methyl ester carboxylesterase
VGYKEAEMTTFVLVHGGFHGGWCWKRLLPLLHAAGHDVYTPTLTGLGERVHLAHPAIGLETHIQDILNVFEYEDLNSVVLVGHSWGGIIITSVADRIPHRIAHLVYLDAAIPQNGQSTMGMLKDEAAEIYSEWAELIRTQGDGWRLPVPPNVIDMLGITKPEDVQWVSERLTAHPSKPLEDPVLLTHHTVDIPSTFIACIGTNPPGGTPSPEAAGRRYQELPTGHNAMVTMPEALATFLMDVA